MEITMNVASPEVSGTLNIADMHIVFAASANEAKLNITDAVNGKCAQISCTGAQLAAIMCLAISFDGMDDYPEVQKLLYQIIGEEIDELPNNLRPIP